jgi:uncharacterized protein (DUF2126 family)
MEARPSEVKLTITQNTSPSMTIRLRDFMPDFTWMTRWQRKCSSSFRRVIRFLGFISVLPKLQVQEHGHD